MTVMCALWRCVEVMLNCFGLSYVFTPVSRQCLKSLTFSLCLSLVSSCLDQIWNVLALLMSQYQCPMANVCLIKNVSTPSLLCFNVHFPGGPGLASTRMSPFWILLKLSSGVGRILLWGRIEPPRGRGAEGTEGGGVRGGGPPPRLGPLPRQPRKFLVI